MLKRTFNAAKRRAKSVLRNYIPAHRRFIRAGESFRSEGEPEVHQLPRLVQVGTVAIDVGAHIGDYTYSLCKQVGPSGKVIAIEPQPDLAELLRRATVKLRLPVTVHCCALSSKEGEAELLIPNGEYGQMAGFATLESRTEDGKVCRVPLRRLDDICRGVEGRISFIKIDVEGHELEVLKGALETLKKHRPSLLVEIEQRHTKVPIWDTFNFITSLGYRGEFLDHERTLQPLERFDLNKHQGDVSRSSGMRYVNNFIFCPADGSN